ncbi:MAG: hypothetical protein ACPH3L_02735 [Flavobacteriaceae bacterium]
MKRIGVFFIFLFVFGCNSNDEPTFENKCNVSSEIISSEDFSAVSYSNYVITKVEINEDCIEITFSSSGCGTELWKEHLFSVDSFYTTFPYQRALKMELINEELCEANFIKTVSFNLIPLQLEGQDLLPLNIYGWNEQVIYEY